MTFSCDVVDVFPWSGCGRRFYNRLACRQEEWPSRLSSSSPPERIGTALRVSPAARTSVPKNRVSNMICKSRSTLALLTC